LALEHLGAHVPIFSKVGNWVAYCGAVIKRQKIIHSITFVDAQVLSFCSIIMLSFLYKIFISENNLLLQFALLPNCGLF
jgi:hypothetical protein